MVERTYKPKDGRIFLQWRSSHQDEAARDTALRSLTKNKAGNLLRMEHAQHSKLLVALDALTPYKGLFEHLELGSFARILSMHCTEELVNYLERVRSIWQGMCRHGAHADDLDATTIGHLELRMPINSMDDRNYLQQMFDSRAVFNKVIGEQRQRLLTFVLSCSRMITIRSFLQDVLYLEACHAAMKKVLPLDGHVQISYRSQAMQRFQRAPGFFLTNYIELWLYTMRHFPELSELPCAALRKDIGRHTPPKARVDHLKVQQLAYLAAGLGFSSDSITTLLGSCTSIPPREQPSERKAELTNAYLPITEKQRCNRPTQSSLGRDKEFMFLEHVYQTDNNTVMLYPTTFSVLRDLVHCFFASSVDNIDDNERFCYDEVTASMTTLEHRASSSSTTSQPQRQNEVLSSLLEELEQHQRLADLNGKQIEEMYRLGRQQEGTFQRKMQLLQAENEQLKQSLRTMESRIVTRDSRQASLSTDELSHYEEELHMDGIGLNEVQQGYNDIIRELRATSDHSRLRPLSLSRKRPREDDYTADQPVLEDGYLHVVSRELFPDIQAYHWRDHSGLHYYRWSATDDAAFSAEVNAILAKGPYCMRFNKSHGVGATTTLRSAANAETALHTLSSGEYAIAVLERKAE